jgi:hypothetical protein
MHKITFFPLGNADTCRIILENGKRILFDYADMKDPEDDDDLRCDLPALIREDLDEAGRKFFDVVAFTHLDEDHYKGASEFFWLEHDSKYQSKDRVKIKTMWVPAAVITEEGTENEEGKIVRREARYRFKEGKGIRVFSRPERLRKWCEKNKIDFESRKGVITDAGQLAPEFSKSNDGVEFFVHSPFAKRLNEREVEDRNDDALVMQATFQVEGVETKVLLMSDISHEVIADIVEITRDKKKRADRLEWDIVKISHHCSYKAIGPEKGDDQTVPVENVKWLYTKQQQVGAFMVSTSKFIPKKGTTEDEDPCPPHRQAANYYKSVLVLPATKWLVTMEHPKQSGPKPIEFEIGRTKANLKKVAASAGFVATERTPPRAA